jgi:hypothetical protein
MLPLTTSSFSLTAHIAQGSVRTGHESERKHNEVQDRKSYDRHREVWRQAQLSSWGPEQVSVKIGTGKHEDRNREVQDRYKEV